ncbi:MAG TPA: tyrosine--tRNA ligase [Planctomycetaceae bacterium]|nr:tyrosine--tRNA ligase [Planctomycetaceae bacterium]
MNNISSNIIKELSARKLVHQTTDESLERWLSEKPRTLYNGCDPTADSLHIGHMVALMNLRRFQQAGHKPIALVGGATGMIGDPSGKSEERKLLTLEDVRKNVEGIKRQMTRFLDFESDAQNVAVLVNNNDWIGEFSFIGFLRDVGKHFPVNVMLAKDSVKSRLAREDSGLSYTEFSYMLLQSYDFVHLHREFGCEMQIGGSDQWGNITAGIDLARRFGIEARLFGLTWPLLLKSDGKKMGKSEAGAIWLDPKRTSPYQFYQYWINTEDADVATGLNYFSERPLATIEEILREHMSCPEKRTAQRILAEDVTRLVHGPEGFEAACRATDIFFGGEIEGLSDLQLGTIFSDVPSCEMPRSVLDDGLPLIDAMVATKLAGTKSDARRTIQQGGAYVNNKPARELERRLTAGDLASESILVLRSGKKRYALVRFV